MKTDLTGVGENTFVANSNFGRRTLIRERYL
jgi:hypothetical protein